MSVTLTAARYYIAAPPDGFWSWSEGGEVVSWISGETICFRAELLAVLSRLAPRGLPALDEILLVLAACRENWRPASLLIDVPWSADGTSYEVQQTLPQFIQDAMAGFGRVHKLPAELRETLEAKQTLVEFVFESRSPLVPPEIAAVVLTLLRSGPGVDTQWLRGTAALRAGAIQGSLRWLAKTLRNVEPEALRLRRRTGLDDLVEPADVESEPEDDGIRGLIARLSDDPELGGLARLARNLMAVVQLPRSVSDPDDLPLGGVSDITNRGSLDRLLLSELAHDDLTLAVRVAVNEALYLRRESPPRTPPEQRAILVDCGLRLWGVPRLFAASVALALAANTDRAVAVSAWGTAGGGLVPIDLSTREGLIAQLELLDPALHAGDALPAFAEELTRLGESPEPLLVTAVETLDDAGLQRILSDLALPRLFLAAVDRDGTFQLWCRTLRGRRLLREARFDLESILAPRVSPRTLLKSELSIPLPEAVGPTFPLRLPHRVDEENSWRRDATTLYALTRDGRLMMWDARERGAIQLATGLPRGHLLWADDDNPAGVVRFVVRRGSSWNLVLLTVRLDEGVVVERTLEWDGVVASAFRSGDCLVVHRHGFSRIVAYDLATGARVDAEELPISFEVGRRFRFTGSEPRLAAISVQNQKLRVDAVPIPESVREAGELKVPPQAIIRPRAFFEQRGHDGPFLITSGGEFVCLVHGTRRPLSTGLRSLVEVLDTDRNGERALIHAREGSASDMAGALGRGRFVVNVETGHRTSVANWIKSIAQWDALQLTSQRLVRSKFTAVAPVAGPTLLLISRTGQGWRISLENGKMLLLRWSPAQYTGVRGFREVRSPRDGFFQREFTSSLGDRVIVDGRGVLHLASAVSKVPSALVALAPEQLAGCCSDGRTWGDPYFLKGEPTASPEQIFFDVIQPFARRLLQSPDPAPPAHPSKPPQP